jgi:hypothetical protein
MRKTADVQKNVSHMNMLQKNIFFFQFIIFYYYKKRVKKKNLQYFILSIKDPIPNLKFQEIHRKYYNPTKIAIKHNNTNPS